MGEFIDLISFTDILRFKIFRNKEIIVWLMLIWANAKMGADDYRMKNANIL